MRLVYTLTLLLIALTSFGQLHILKDVNDESVGNTQASMGNNFGSSAIFNGRFYFGAYQQVTLDKIWSTDGTEAGTKIVETPLKGDVGGYFAVMDDFLYMSLTSADSSGIWKFDRDLKFQWVSSTGGEMITSGSKLIFFTRYRSGVYELWRTDGTTDGTFKLADIPNLQNSIFQGRIKPFGDKLFYLNSDGVHGNELWVTDGTLTGTKMVVDINPAGDGVVEGNFQIINNEFYFNSADGYLWKTDGTETGTIKFSSIHISANFLAHVGTKCIVGHEDATDGRQFYIYDLASQDYTFFRDVTPGPKVDGELNGWAKAFKNAIYFILRNGDDYQLWKTDGTEQSTSLAYSFDLPEGYRIQEMWTVNDKIFLETYSPDNKGTYYLMAGDDVNPFATIFTGAYVFDRIPFGDKFLTVLTDDIHDYEPWISDGTTSGTHMIKDIETLTSAGTTDIAVNNGKLFIFNEDGFRKRSLWTSDGSEEGTTKLTEGLPPYNLHPPLYVHDTKSFFVNIDGTHGKELWTTDGTSAGTFMLKDAIPGTDGWDVTSMLWKGDVGYYNVTNDLGGYQLWKTDGTTVGTVKATADGFGFDVTEAIIFKDEFYYSRLNALTKSDGGSVQSTVKIIDPTGTVDFRGAIRGLKTGTNYFFFGADDKTHGNEMWISDGTDGGTHMIKDIHTASNDDASYSVQPAIIVNDVVYFVAAETNDKELWRSDGTDAGTYVVKDINPNGSSNAGNFRIVGNTILFTADDGTHGTEIWKTDGTSAGTVMVRDIKPGSTSSNVAFSVISGSTQYLTADDGVHGVELWVTDGTENNTTLIKDVHPGPHNMQMYTQPTVVIDDHAYFIMDDGTHGFNLWRSDGTAKGTLRIDGSALLNLPAGYYPAIVSLNNKVFL
ncbi:MAG: ELWxxDGT repeat protein [Bacteroidota bacterium]